MIVTFFILITAIIFRFKGFVSGNEWVDVSKSVGLGFIAGNSAEGVIGVLKDHLALRRAAGSITTPAPDPEDDDVQIQVAGDSK
jgi:hypothetical protein